MPERPEPIVLARPRQAWVQILLVVLSAVACVGGVGILGIGAVRAPDMSPTSASLVGILGVVVVFLGLVLAFVGFVRSWRMFSLYRRLPVEQRDRTRPLLLGAGFLGLLAPVLPLVLALFCCGSPWLGSPPDPATRVAPHYDGAALFPSARPDLEVAPRAQEALAGGYERFVAAPDAQAAGDPGLLAAGQRDETLFAYVAASARTHGNSWTFWERLEQVKGDYADVSAALADAGLPAVLAAIPYVESTYDSDLISPGCAAGPWQLTPEVAARQGLIVRDFPECEFDERNDLQRSTGAAIALLDAAWSDPEIRASGAAVPLTIAAHFAGLDDAPPNPANVKPALAGWKKDASVPIHWFPGDSIRTERPDEKGWNGSALNPETQHAMYTVIAVHLLAVCYYGQNHTDIVAFSAWEADARSWCRDLEVPFGEETEHRIERKRRRSEASAD